MTPRIVSATKIINDTAALIRSCNTRLPQDISDAIRECARSSDNEQERMLLEVISENARIASEKDLPLCQDTGLSIFFVEAGKVLIDDGRSIPQLLNEAVRLAYSEHRFRPSIIDDPLGGKNSSDNTPAFIHIESTNDDRIKISYLAKGGGCENASGTSMLNPSDGFAGIKDFILGLVRQKGPNSCPPLIVGVGIGGTIDHAMISSKKALLRKIGQRNPKEDYSKREMELRSELNSLGIGAMGLGGRCTVLDVFIEESPRHMATLPVAVSILCHSARRGSIVI